MFTREGYFDGRAAIVSCVLLAQAGRAMCEKTRKKARNELGLRWRGKRVAFRRGGTCKQQKSLHLRIYMLQHKAETETSTKNASACCGTRKHRTRGHLSHTLDTRAAPSFLARSGSPITVVSENSAVAQPYRRALRTTRPRPPLPHSTDPSTSAVEVKVSPDRVSSCMILCHGLYLPVKLMAAASTPA